MCFELRRSDAGDRGKLRLRLWPDPCDRLDRRVVQDHVRGHPRRPGGLESPRLQSFHEVGIGRDGFRFRRQRTLAALTLDLIPPSDLEQTSIHRPSASISFTIPLMPP